MPGFNPEPSAVRISRMLSYHVPKLAPSFGAAVKPPGMMKSPAVKPPRIGRALGGGIVDHPDAPFTGAIATSSLGRADHEPMHVPPGSYVVSAEDVSHIGEGNTMAGFDILHAMFGNPYGVKGGPWGSAMPHPQGKLGPPKPIPPRILGVPRPNVYAGPEGATGPPTTGTMARGAHGGVIPPVGPPQKGTPINASGGEFVIRPQEVARRGGGDLNKGHQILDRWVRGLRQDQIRTLQKLPGPAR